MIFHPCRMKFLPLLLLLAFATKCITQTNCSDALKEQIYDRCVHPYFDNLNRLIGMGAGYEESNVYQNWEGLFVEVSGRTKRFIPQDFVQPQHDPTLASTFSLGAYILELQLHWQGNEFGFTKPDRDEVYYAKFNNQYIVVFEKYIAGTLKVKMKEKDKETVIIYEDANSTYWLKLTLNNLYKIEQIDIISTVPTDRDNDKIIDEVAGKKTDLEPQKRGLLKFNGRPDTDCDGVEDLEDKCKNEGRAGYITANGCPDSDRDGVPDNEDRKPNVAGLVRCQGDTDKDGDGVCDYDDDCPNDWGNNRYGCMRPPKPYIIALKPYYGVALPLGNFKGTEALTGTDFNWTREAGFARFGPLHFGLSIDVSPMRYVGFGFDAFYWKLPFDSDLFGRLLNTYYSRRVSDFEGANTSAAAYQGFCVVGRFPLGVFQRRFSVRAEPQFGFCFNSTLDNSLSALILLKNANDILATLNLMPEKFPVYGLNLAVSHQVDWGDDRHFGFEARVSWLKGEFSPLPNQIDPFPGVKPISFGTMSFEMVRFTVGATYSFWTPPSPAHN